MAVTSTVEGGVGTTFARIKAKVSGATTELLIADNSELIGAQVVSSTALPSSRKQFDPTGLVPNMRRYWWAVRDDGVVDDSKRGTFLTHPTYGSRSKWTFAAASCAGAEPESPGVGSVLASNRISNHEVFETIRARALAENWLFFAHLGDAHYYDLNDDDATWGITGGGSLANYVRAWDDIFTQSNQERLYRELPLVQSAGGGGHDFGQPIGLARTLPGRNNCFSAWRTCIADYDTANSAPNAGTWRSFMVDRVLFVVTDENSDRDPDVDAEGVNKTKLGPAQKAWLRDTLATTNAEVLVWLSGAQWHRGGSGNWGRYTTERSELIAMFAELGWLHRMVFITGDRHALEIIPGANNPLGGFPLWHFASLDSPPADLTVPPGSLGNNRYGTVTVEDTGDKIILTGTGWIGSEAWASDQLVVNVASTSEPGLPIPAPTAGQAVKKVTWFGCDITTGRIIEEIPDIFGSVGRRLGSYASTSQIVPLTGNRDITERLIAMLEPRSSLIVGVINDLPMWTGQVNRTQRGTGVAMQLGLTTPEGYWSLRRVRDHAWVNQDIASVIAAGLMGDAEAIDGVGQGLNIMIDAPAMGVLHDRTYVRKDRKTVLAALQELMGISGGPEFTIDAEWTDSTQTGVMLVARVRPHIGVESTMPTAVFENSAEALFDSQGPPNTLYEYTVDASDGRYANVVYAYSSGEGDDQPEGEPAIDYDALAADRPIVEHHFMPGSGITEPGVLTDHAAARLARIKNGSRTFKLVTRWDATPRLGVDWRIGDDVAWDLKGHGHPNGVKGRGRVIGYDLDMQAETVNLILLDPSQEGIDA